jgi:hypothetical protein
MRGKLRARLGPSKRELEQEAWALTMLQPFKDWRLLGEEPTLAEVAALPRIPGRTLDEVCAMGPKERARMKREQEEFYGKPWGELATADSLGVFALKRRKNGKV